MEHFIQWLLENSIKASVLAILVGVVCMVFSKQISPRWKYFLWILVAIRLVMPNMFPAEFSIFNLCNSFVVLEKQETVHTAHYAQAEMPLATSEVPPSVKPGKKADSVMSYFKGLSMWAIIFMLWSAGAFVLGLVVLYRNYRLSSRVCLQRPLVDQKLLELLEDCKERMNIHVPVSVVSTKQVKSPALMGFIRPRLLLPEEMMKSISFEDMRYIFLHELMHLKRKDIVINWLVTVIQIMHWFNPFAWYSFARLRADREQACDASVLALIGQGERKDYGFTIIRLLEILPRQNPVTSMAGILEDKQQVKRRIEMIRNFRIMPFSNSLLIVALISGLGLLCFSEETKPISKEKEQTEKTTVIDGKANSVKINQETKEVIFEGNASVSKEGKGRILADKIIVKDDMIKAIGNPQMVVSTISDKMNSIIIDKIEFKETPIPIVITYLNGVAKKLDPEKKGIKISLRLTAKQSKNPPKVSINVVNMPIGDLVKLISEATGLEYHVRDNGVHIGKEMELGSEKVKSTLKKLDDITIKHIEFKEVSIYDWANFLQQKSIELDTEKKGVNIMVNLDAEAGKNPPKITMVVDDISLCRAIDYAMVATGLKYQINDSGTVIISR